MKSLLLNGGGGAPEARPTPAAKAQSAKPPSQSTPVLKLAKPAAEPAAASKTTRADVQARSAAQDQAVLSLLR